MNFLNKWRYKPAKWYQFWMPQSDAIGGSILGFIIGTLIAATFIYFLEF